MSTFLTAGELEELTDLHQPAAQVRWLTSRGWPFEIAATGKVKVLRAVMEKKMGVVTLAGRRPSTPDADALKEMMSRGKKKAS